MGSTLDKVVSEYVHNNAEEKQEEPDILSAAEDAIKKRIVEEIEPVIKEKVKVEVETEENEKKLEELKEIIWSGFLVAFFVGLLVNQVTDVITHLKGDDNMQGTLAAIIILLLLCLAVFLYMFIAKVKKIYDAIKKK